ncbi:hypothetical protein NHH03_20925 [Stieleria sp. TO1_6]|uniref:hypothetical protein n=1 Tax=Stieleria tagensis TaxID=2956795 RepID=UPI00209AC8D7|nr:hypothetical protein [Stieleria tagensis]MCO8124219.1 hypothetical protein [Stieleria tagensis]
MDRTRHRRSDSARPQRGALPIALTGATAVALITYGVCFQLQSPSSPPFAGSPMDASDTEMLQTGGLDSVALDSATADRVARAHFYDIAVVPLIAQLDDQNRAAADRCVLRLKDVLAGYHRGVDHFVSDMTSITTRLGVIKRMPGGWWASDDRVAAYVQDKFETHLFSQQKLVDDVSAALVQFRTDVNANQNRMLTQVQAALSTADLTGVQLSHQESFFQQRAGSLGDYAADQGTHSVENMLGAFVLGEVGAFAGRSIVGGLLVRFAPSIAIGSAAGASATVGASATGAGGGSLGGPVGAVVGFGAGLAIGLVIDWWMTDRFEAELGGQLHTYLDDLQAALIAGNEPKAQSGAAPLEDVGLAVALPRVCDQLAKSYRDRFYHQIVDGESS